MILFGAQKQLMGPTRTSEDIIGFISKSYNMGVFLNRETLNIPQSMGRPSLFIVLLPRGRETPHLNLHLRAKSLLKTSIKKPRTGTRSWQPDLRVQCLRVQLHGVFSSPVFVPLFFTVTHETPKVPVNPHDPPAGHTAGTHDKSERTAVNATR